MTSPSQPSILGSLRAVTSKRAITFDEALRVAELQASKLARIFHGPGDDLCLAV